jgi:ABC-type uncharacterized transport system YnjBCD ATPase subunit
LPANAIETVPANNKQLAFTFVFVVQCFPHLSHASNAVVAHPQNIELKTTSTNNKQQTRQNKTALYLALHSADRIWNYLLCPSM